MLTGNKEFNKALERKWTAWAREINLPAKLRTMYAAKVVDGEAFAERINNQRLRNGVNVDIRVTEADLWTDPLWAGNSVQEDDGIRYDRVGNPELYRRLKYHPATTSLICHRSTMKTSAPRTSFIGSARIDRTSAVG